MATRKTTVESRSVNFMQKVKVAFGGFAFAPVAA